MSIFRRNPTLQRRVEHLEAAIRDLGPVLKAGAKEHGEFDERIQALGLRLAEIEHELEGFRLDYQGLYDKARTTLSRLAKREKDAEQDGAEDPILKARKALTLRKITRAR